MWDFSWMHAVPFRWLRPRLHNRRRRALQLPLRRHSHNERVAGVLLTMIFTRVHWGGTFLLLPATRGRHLSLLTTRAIGRIGSFYSS